MNLSRPPSLLQSIFSNKPSSHPRITSSTSACTTSPSRPSDSRPWSAHQRRLDRRARPCDNKHPPARNLKPDPGLLTVVDQLLDARTAHVPALTIDRPQDAALRAYRQPGARAS